MQSAATTIEEIVIKIFAELSGLWATICICWNISCLPLFNEIKLHTLHVGLFTDHPFVQPSKTTEGEIQLNHSQSRPMESKGLKILNTYYSGLISLSMTNVGYQPESGWGTPGLGTECGPPGLFSDTKSCHEP